MKKTNFFSKLVFVLILLPTSLVVQAQVTFPENGVADPRHGHYAFTNATIVKDATTTLTNATLVIKDGKITAVGAGLKVPAGAVEIDCKGKYIYPSFIDIYTDYGTPQRQAGTGAGGGFNFNQAPQIETAVKGPFGWNQAIKSEVDVYKVFSVSDATAKPLREAGFGSVLTHVKDGVARGTGAVVTLANEKENLVIIKEKASAHYSFNKGTSTQSYPSSMMGYIALLRQTYLDAAWYKTKPYQEGFNATLQSWNDNQSLPQIFEANDKWNDLRSDRIGDEFGVQYIIKAGQNEYQRIKEMKATNATFILPLNYPVAQDVEDPNDARFVSLNDMKHWELAPTNAAAFEKAGIPFCLTTADLRTVTQFWTNLRKAMEYGLSENKVIEALTKTPATTLGVYDKVGSLDAGKLGNFLITNGPIFSEKSIILQNWVQGIKYTVKEDAASVAGTYALTVNTPSGTEKYTLDVKSASSVTMYAKDTLNSKFTFDGKQVKISFAPMVRRQRPAGAPGQTPDTTRRPGGGNPGAAGFPRGGSTEQALPATATRLGGISNGTEWNGTGTDSLGNPLTWTATLIKLAEVKQDSSKKKDMPVVGKVVYPFEPFGWSDEEKPKQETILIKNATVWTNEKEGVLENADVLIKDGKISAVGKNLSDASARIIDGTGKHVTAGIIDEHSHIAAASINEGAQSVTSEVRIADNLNPDDINIYRQLSGGVTSSHILHGSANVIGGQTQLIKLRWGANDDDLKFKNWPGQIKFALGENVKRSNFNIPGGNNRYPDTRMGVEQVLEDAFTRAKDYQKEWKGYNDAKDKKGLSVPRRDLELEALVEILEKKRFITCHSYVQSEINMAMEVANRMGYTVNTFTHILEGYKVADKMLKHGSFVSTFSDWWAYKMEVEDAIPYNAAIMQKVGLTVAINSDDAEMARRLNQEAGKIVKYGGVTEEEALKMVTLNPAKMLHVDNKVGSLKVGKDGDVVLWSDNPLSIYAKSLYTIVDGTVYFDRKKDELMQKDVDAERLRLVRKMNGEKRSGAPTIPAQPSYQIMHTCSDHGHSHGLLVIDSDDMNND
ncbi:MAG: amidohydrolase family protein [Chitinophagaceae bacterium]|nr:amidohydrolase family protein [Chitinophagaceae bacterium]MBK7680627.1 amidohydrolase family protein [Chitinophagaceae bacterium]MBK8300569.1 amidohydrolase family protein [Chitinophagaceae bacterium]MBK9465077.1 amidohydrolase family protein [Chitinophagaceae bacterium]MBK9660190.1 amidohydrolase family protein [Chitinophagaceae bacterium]